MKTMYKIYYGLSIIGYLFAICIIAISAHHIVIILGLWIATISTMVLLHTNRQRNIDEFVDACMEFMSDDFDYSDNHPYQLGHEIESHNHSE